MIIDNNPKGLEAMEAFHRGTEKKDYNYRRNLLLRFGKSLKAKTIARAKKHAVIMETVKNV